MEDYTNLSQIERLEIVARAYFKSLSNVSSLIGRSKQVLNNYKAPKGGKPVNFGSKMIKELKEKLSINPEFIYEGKLPMILEEKPDDEIFKDYLVKVYDIPVHANIGSLASFEDLTFSYQELPVKIKGVDLKNVVGFRVLGNSMFDAGIRPNTYIFVDTSRRDPFQITNGETVVVKLNGTMLVKIWKRVNGKVELHSANEGIPPIEEEIDDRLVIIGIVLKEYWSAI